MATNSFGLDCSRTFSSCAGVLITIVDCSVLADALITSGLLRTTAHTRPLDEAWLGTVRCAQSSMAEISLDWLQPSHRKT
jgi:hypothetical protein